MHFSNLIESLFHKVSAYSAGRPDLDEEQVSLQVSEQYEKHIQKLDTRVEELVQENEQLRHRLNVYRTGEEDKSNSKELMNLLYESQSKLDSKNTLLEQELVKMRKERDFLNKEWEKQVVDLT